MSLRRKPHAITIVPVANSYTSARVDAPEEGTPVGIKGQITPMTSEQAYKQFGIESIKPHLMLTDVADGQSLKIGDRVLYNSRSFFLKADPMIWGAGQSTDHCQILISVDQP